MKQCKCLDLFNCKTKMVLITRLPITKFYKFNQNIIFLFDCIVIIAIISVAVSFYFMVLTKNLIWTGLQHIATYLCFFYFVMYMLKYIKDRNEHIRKIKFYSYNVIQCYNTICYFVERKKNNNILRLQVNGYNLSKVYPLLTPRLSYLHFP